VSPVDVLAELIWSALDAGAMNVKTTGALGAMDVPEEIVIGMTIGSPRPPATRLE
jgi:hypothetical protein